MDFLRRQKQHFNRNTLDQLCPVKSYDEEGKLLWGVGDKNTSFLAFAFIVSPLPGVPNGSDALLRSVYDNEFTPNTMAEIYHFSTTNVKARIMLYARSRAHVMNDSSDPKRAEFAQELVKERTNLFLDGQKNKMDDMSECNLKDSYALVTFRIPVDKSPSEEQFKAVRSLQVSCESQLKTIGFYPTVVDHELYISLMRSIVYFNDERTMRMDLNAEINQQIFDNDTDLEVAAEHLRINENYYRIMSVQEFPEDMVLPQMTTLLGCPRGTKNQITCDFIIKTVIYYPDPHTERQRINKESASMRVQAMGKFGQMVRRIGMKDQNYQLLTQSLEEGHRPVRIWTSVMLMADELDTIEKQSSSLKGYWSVQGFRCNTDKLIQGPLFNQILPLCASPEVVGFTNRYNTMTINEAVHLLPVLSDWSGPGPGATCMFYSRRGQLIPWSNFDSDTSYNALLIGTSGSGKSFILNDLVAGSYSQGMRIRIIDSGRSYKNLIELLGGEFIEFTPDADICLNPFTNIRSIDDELPALKVILEQLAAPKQGLTDYQLARLEEITLNVWNEYGNDMDITLLSEHIIRFGEKHDDEPVRHLGAQLMPWCRHGTGGKWFDGRANLTMSGDISCLELDDLGSMIELRTVALLLMVNNLQRDIINGDRSIRTQLIVDEYWRFGIGDDPGSIRVNRFLEESFRVLRKANAAAIIGTQSLLDIVKDGKSPLIDNSANVILMKQKVETLEAIKTHKLLNISDHDFDLLKTLNKGNGYSDCFIYTATRGFGFARFVVERFSQLLYTTNAQELTKIKGYRSGGLSLTEAIHKYIEDENAEKALADSQPKKAS